MAARGQRISTCGNLVLQDGHCVDIVMPYQRFVLLPRPAVALPADTAPSLLAGFARLRYFLRACEPPEPPEPPAGPEPPEPPAGPEPLRVDIDVSERGPERGFSNQREHGPERAGRSLERVSRRRSPRDMPGPWDGPEPWDSPERARRSLERAPREPSREHTAAGRAHADGI